MAIIAVAGGTGGMGRSIIDQIKLGGKHEVFVLSQRNHESPTALKCDYTDIESLVTLFEDNRIDTVISTINIGSDAAGQSQLNLIAAAAQSRVTKRFIPSHYTTPFDDSDKALEQSPDPSAPAAKALRKTTLGYTFVCNGVFMDYWGMPHISTYLDEFKAGIDIANRRAAIPGSGDERFSTTYSVDVARFVVALLDLATWPKFATVSGSDTSYNEILDIAKRVTGAEFDVGYYDEDSIRKGDVTRLTSQLVPGVFDEESRELMMHFELMVLGGAYLLPSEDRLNDVFPDMPPMGIEEMIEKAWSLKNE